MDPGSPTPPLTQAWAEGTSDCPSTAHLAHQQINARRDLDAKTQNLARAQSTFIAHFRVCVPHSEVTLRAGMAYVSVTW